jgi:hypothetical protein
MATPTQIENLRSRLVQVAKSKKKVAYSTVDYLVGLDVIAIPRHRGDMGSILAKIGAKEREAGRPFLAAVVVRLKNGRLTRPGPGFYEEVRRHEPKYSKIGSNPLLHDAVLADVYRYWDKK